MKQTEPSEDMLLEYIRGDAPLEVHAEVEAWMGADPENEAMLLDMARVYYMLRRAERIRRRDVVTAYELHWLVGFRRANIGKWNKTT